MRAAKTESIVTKPITNNIVEAVQVTEVIDKDDRRVSPTEMKQAIMEEMRHLLLRATFKVILKKELPDGANALTDRFMLAIKSNTDSQVKYKARYVIGGHWEKI